jgi:hypothetical protein
VCSEERRKHLLAGTGVDYAEGIKITDPRRMAVYCAKYGTAGVRSIRTDCPTNGWTATSSARSAGATTTRTATSGP